MSLVVVCGCRDVCGLRCLFDCVGPEVGCMHVIRQKSEIRAETPATFLRSLAALLSHVFHQRLLIDLHRRFSLQKIPLETV